MEGLIVSDLLAEGEQMEVILESDNSYQHNLPHFDDNSTELVEYGVRIWLANPEGKLILKSSYND